MLFSDIYEWMLDRPINNQLVRLGRSPKALKRRDNMLYQRTLNQLVSLNELSLRRHCHLFMGDIFDLIIGVLLVKREVCRGG